MPNGYFKLFKVFLKYYFRISLQFYKLLTIAQLSALVIFVSVALLRKKSERVERKLKTQNPNLSMASPVRSSSVRNASRLHIKKANYFKLS